MAQLRVSRASSLAGTFRPPSDKSLTHRGLLLAAAATSPSRIRMPLRSEDAQATESALRAMGASFEWDADGVTVTPAVEWQTPESPLDCGNSGTTMRLLAGMIASRPVEATLVGDASLSRRPMKRVAEPLRQMGAAVEGDTPPLTIRGGSLRGIRYATPVASAQVKSAILLAGLRAEGETWVREPSPSRDHTERMLTALGVPLLTGIDGVGVAGGAAWSGFDLRVPGDISSAAFLMVAAALLPDGWLEIDELSVNPTRTGIFDVFSAGQIPVTREGETSELGEPVARVTVRASKGAYQPFRIDGDLVPRLIDEIPVLAVLATQCDGVSEIRDASELRVKESDRIERVAQSLRAMGASVDTFADGMAIAGPVDLRGAVIDAAGDHRIAMAFAVAGLIAEGETVIEGSEAIATSFPEFERTLQRLLVH